jgi:GT2 family glycosyltransferase/spore maturation protein CgeB/polysaccharide pyruvyl transferase WcaK-like protein
LKIAHFGTFDVENYGDLLFPLILERRLSDIADEFVHVSPSGGPPVWEDCVRTVPFEKLLREHPEVDGVVVGGGHIFRCSPTPMRIYQGEDLSSSFAYPSLWLGAAYIAARDNLPLCWNAPGVAEVLSPVAARLARWTASVSDYLSVRDQESRRLLKETDVEQLIEVVPDTALEACRLWSAEELRETYLEAFARRDMGVPEQTIVFHLTARWVDEEVGKIAARIDRICQNAGARAILIALGPCHGDHKLQREIAQQMATGPLLIERPRSLQEVAACIAHAEAYIGSSMHGMITACSFGRRGMLVASRDVTKFAGFLEHFRLSDWQVGSWAEAEAVAGELLSTPPDPWERILEDAMPILDGHWERIRSALVHPEDSSVSTRDKRSAVEQLRQIGSDYLGEDNIFGSIVAENLVNAQKELRETSQDLETLDRWMSDLSANIPALLNSRQWRAGRILGELYRIARRQPRTPTVAGHLDSVTRQYQTWKSKGGRGGAPPAPPQIRESQPEATARAVYELFVSERSLGHVARSIARRAKSVSGRAASTSRRRLRRELRKLKYRIPREELAKETRRRLGPVPRLAESPSVSIVVLNRNGLKYLKKLFHGLQEYTDYPDLEVVLVDNGSTDGSVEFVRSLDMPFEVKLVENQENVSFSDGNNQGARLADGELLLFMNNDIEPFEPGWLEEMVGFMGSSGAGAVGARLLYPGVTEHETPSGYAVQHRGVKFRKVQGLDYPRNLGMGEDALDKHLGEDTRCPATTAACLLMGRDMFDAVGGFTTGYRYGSEDVDLGLKVLSSGREVVSSGRTVLFHDESSSQNTEGRGFMRANRTGNRKLFLGRWAPQLHRRLELERLGPGTFWTEEKPHAAITVTSHDVNDGYGDWYTAHEMGDALEALGWRVSYVQRKRNEWYKLPQNLDYLLVLIDQYDISRVPTGVQTVAWVRNWTDRWVSHPWFEDYDVVLASSGASKGIIERETNQTVAELFPLAANPRRFARTPENEAYRSDYVFTGNFWGELRGAVDTFEAVAEDERFLVFGKGWENVPEAAPYARGQAHYDQLPGIYSSAKLVVDDTASPTLPYGAVNSRVFDALATGTLVVTNCEAGVRELFDEDFPTYSSPQELREILDRLLKNEGLREELAGRYQKAVLRDHTYGRRAEQLAGLLRRRADALSFCIKIGAPNWEAARSWGDLHYARAMRRQLELRGHRCIIQTLDQWENPVGLECDVAVHLKGLTPYETKPGQLNVLWNISHPGKLTAAECDGYDLVLVASKRWADRLKTETTTPVFVMEQATDPEVFFPDYEPIHDRELVFVGNSRRVERRILRDLLPTDRDLAVWGGDWEGLIDEKYVAGKFLPNRQVRKAYSSASIVLNDHWDDMREHGFVSNRVYDALACGALVISDDLPGLRENFGDAVVTYSSPEELRELVEHYLASPEEGEQKGRQGREMVLAHHTFEQRIEELLRHVEERLEEPALRARIRSLDRMAERT